MKVRAVCLWFFKVNKTDKPYQTKGCRKETKKKKLEMKEEDITPDNTEILGS